MNNLTARLIHLCVLPTYPWGLEQSLDQMSVHSVYCTELKSGAQRMVIVCHVSFYHVSLREYYAPYVPPVHQTVLCAQ